MTVSSTTNRVSYAGNGTTKARVAIRKKYDEMQVKINAATTPEALKAIVASEGL